MAWSKGTLEQSQGEGNRKCLSLAKGVALVYLDWEGKGSLFLPAWGGSDSPGEGIGKQRQVPTSDGRGPRSIAKSSAGLNSS